ncbi:MAG: sodium-dependent transporter [Chlamydiae bacterium RIFCSPHIGHO2_12_FULL_49_11]|nr:MAG: sodium-dependent transporter [Chlamydiae bacterium RIFCSPHIGHO2_12_FULL_49_11]
MSTVREHFSSKVGFLFAALGSAIGLGVLWKFPYVVGKNGGGAFLLCYLAAILFIAVPVFIGELMMGRRSARASVGAFQVLSPARPGFAVGGYLGMAVAFLIMSFYSVIAGWGISYLWMSLMGSYDHIQTPLEMQALFRTLIRSPDICLVWHVVFTAVTTLIVYSGVRKGIEKWSRYMTQALLIILAVIVVYNMTLPGFGRAVRFIFYPDWAGFHISSILEAIGLAFFTMSLGQGIMFSYGSYVQREEDLLGMGVVVGGAVMAVSLLAALAIFPVVFSFGFEPDAGTGLVFETLPFLFKKLAGGKIIATAFFSLFVFTAMTSAIAFIEVVASNLMEMYGIVRSRAVLIAAASTCLFGIPSVYAFSGGIFPVWDGVYGMNFLDTVDTLVSTWLIPLGGLIISVFIGWEMKAAVKKEEFDISGSRYRLYSIWRFLLRYVIPVSLFLILIGKVYKV